MFGALEILYLFLGGTGAGLCLVSSSLGLFSPKENIAVRTPGGLPGRPRVMVAVPPPYRVLLGPALGVSAALVLIGVLCLVFALGRPQIVLGVFLSSGFSWANVGAFSLVICVLLAVVQALIVAGYVPCPLWVYRFCGVLALAASLCTILYTGFLLYDMRGAAFWHSLFLPLLFMFSSFSCGIGALSFIAVAFRFHERFKGLFSSILRVDFVVVLLEVASLVCFLLVRPDQGESAPAVAASISALLQGNLALTFWVLFVGVGLALPLALEFWNGFGGGERLDYVLVVLAGTLLTGGVALRYCVVAAAAHPFLGAAWGTVL